MCGFVGVVSSTDDVDCVSNDTLTVLQHRGQDAAGIRPVTAASLTYEKTTDW